MRVLLAINSIGRGGAERVLANIVAARGVAVGPLELHLALLDNLPRARKIEPIDEVHQLDARGSLARSIYQLRTLVAEVRPDVVASFLIRANCAAVAATLGRPVRCVVSERMHTASHLDHQYRSRSARFAANLAIRVFYPHAERIIAVSEGVAKGLVNEYAVPASRITTLPNPFNLVEIRRLGDEVPLVSLPKDYCIALGRLVPAKGMDAVIAAFIRAQSTSHLVIVGSGPEEARLRRIAAASGVGERILFVPFQPNPFPLLAGARFLVSASRNEGFPNAAAEAMSLGTPVVLTDCPSGPRELLAATGGGLLVPLDDEMALAEAMKTVANVTQHSVLAANGRSGMIQFALAGGAAAYWDEICGTSSAISR